MRSCLKLSHIKNHRAHRRSQKLTGSKISTCVCGTCGGKSNPHRAESEQTPCRRQGRRRWQQGGKRQQLSSAWITKGVNQHEAGKRQTDRQARQAGQAGRQAQQDITHRNPHKKTVVFIYDTRCFVIISARHLQGTTATATATTGSKESKSWAEIAAFPHVQVCL